MFDAIEAFDWADGEILSTAGYLWNLTFILDSPGFSILKGKFWNAPTFSSIEDTACLFELNYLISRSLLESFEVGLLHYKSAIIDVAFDID